MFENPVTFILPITSRGLLRVASELGKAAGDAAAKACQLAECTMGNGEAMSLSHRSERNLELVQRMKDGVLDLHPVMNQALQTGLRLYIAKLEKLGENAGKLLVPDDATSELLAEVKDALRIIRGDPEPELPLSDATVSFNGGPKIPVDDLERRVKAGLRRLRRKQEAREDEALAKDPG